MLKNIKKIFLISLILLIIIQIATAYNISVETQLTNADGTAKTGTYAGANFSIKNSTAVIFNNISSITTDKNGRFNKTFDIPYFGNETLEWRWIIDGEDTGWRSIGYILNSVNSQYLQGKGLNYFAPNSSLDNGTIARTNKDNNFNSFSLFGLNLGSISNWWNNIWVKNITSERGNVTDDLYLREGVVNTTEELDIRFASNNSLGDYLKNNTDDNYIGFFNTIGSTTNKVLNFFGINLTLSGFFNDINFTTFQDGNEQVLQVDLDCTGSDCANVDKIIFVTNDSEFNIQDNKIWFNTYGMEINQSLIVDRIINTEDNWSNSSHSYSLADFLEKYSDDDSAYTINTSLDNYMNNHFNSKTTDDLTEGSINLYDNQSWNETKSLTLHYTKAETDTEISNANTSMKNYVDNEGFLKNIVEDTTPQLGGNLDGQNYNITTSGTITANPEVLINGDFGSTSSTTYRGVYISPTSLSGDNTVTHIGLDVNMLVGSPVGANVKGMQFRGLSFANGTAIDAEAGTAGIGGTTAIGLRVGAYRSGVSGTSIGIEIVKPSGGAMDYSIKDETISPWAIKGDNKKLLIGDAEDVEIYYDNAKLIIDDTATQKVDFVDNDLTTTGDITANNLNISNWDTAYSWGDHSSEGYLKNIVEDTTPQLGGDLDVNSKDLTELDELKSANSIYLKPSGNNNDYLEWKTSNQFPQMIYKTSATSDKGFIANMTNKNTFFITSNGAPRYEYYGAGYSGSGLTVNILGEGGLENSFTAYTMPNPDVVASYYLTGFFGGIHDDDTNWKTGITDVYGASGWNLYEGTNARTITNSYGGYFTQEFGGAQNLAITNAAGAVVHSSFGGYGSGTTVTNAKGLWVKDTTGNPTNDYGVYIDTITHGTNDWAIYSGGGKVQHVGTYSTTVGGTNRDLFVDSTGVIGYVSSSKSYKENIKNITEDKTKRIFNLRPVTYDRKDNSSHGEMGLIAEEVAIAFPELVSYKTNVIYKNETYQGRDGINRTYLKVDKIEITDEVETVQYSRLIVPLLKEVQELRAENTLMKSELCKKDNSYSWCIQ